MKKLTTSIAMAILIAIQLVIADVGAAQATATPTPTSTPTSTPTVTPTFTPIAASVNQFYGKTAIFTGPWIDTGGTNVCTNAQIWSATTSTATVLFEQSNDKSIVWTVATVSNPSATQSFVGPGVAKYSRLKISAYTGGTLYGNITHGSCGVAAGGSVMTNTGILQANTHTVFGTAALSTGGAVTITLSTKAAYNSTGTYDCIANSHNATAANVSAMSIVKNSGTSFTIQSANASDTSTVAYSCIGH